MTRKRHTEEQIIAVLKWRTKYAGLEVSDVKKLRQLEDENRRLKQMVADQALDIQALKAVTAKNW